MLITFSATHTYSLKREICSLVYDTYKHYQLKNLNISAKINVI